MTAAAVLFAVFQYLKRVAGPARWSDSQRSYQLKTIRKNLLAAQQDLEHPRDWRPFILALSDDKKHMAELLGFSTLIEGNSGMTTAVRVIQSVGFRAAKLKETARKELVLGIKETGVQAFPLVLSAQDISIGLPVLFQSFGIGPVRANTVLLNWNESICPKTVSGDQTDYKLFLRSALQNDCNIILLDQKSSDTAAAESENRKTIDVWWKDDDTSRLMILLAYLITRNEKWEQAEIRLLTFHLDVDNRENIQNLVDMLEEIRINAVPKIVLGADAQSIARISGAADLIFLPVYLKNNKPYIFKDTPAETVIPQLKTVALTMAAQKVELDTEPEEGMQGDLALLLDELRHAEKRVENAEKDVYQTTKAANETMKMVNIEDSFADSRVLKSLKEALTAREKAAAANKKALKERSKLIAISKKAKEQGLLSDPET